MFPCNHCEADVRTKGENRSVKSALLLCSEGHLGSILAVSRLLRSSNLKVVGIVSTRSVPFSWWGIKRAFRLSRRMGYKASFLHASQQVLQEGLLLIGRFAPISSVRFCAVKKLLIEKGSPSLRTKKLNTRRNIEWMREKRPDYIICLFYNRYLRDDVISIPSEGVINLHPGRLPEYAGAFAYIWNIIKDETHCTATINWLTAEVDQGRVISEQSIRIRPNWTQAEIVTVTAIAGARMIANYLDNKPEPCESFKQEFLQNRDSMPREMPSKADYEEYFRRRPMIRLTSLLKILWHKT